MRQRDNPILINRSLIGRFFLYVFIILICALLFGAIAISRLSDSYPTSQVNWEEISEENLELILIDDEITIFEKDRYILLLLKNSSVEVHRSLIQNNFTDASHFVDIKKEFDPETINLLILNNKYYPEDAKWILEKYDDIYVLESLYDSLNQFYPEELNLRPALIYYAARDNPDFAAYIKLNPSKNTRLMNLIATL